MRLTPLGPNVGLVPSNFDRTIRIHFCGLKLRTPCCPAPGTVQIIQTRQSLTSQTNINFLSSLSFQILMKMLQTPHLSSSCCKTLLNTISALLLAENVFLPDSLIKEAIEKVTRTAAYSRNPRVQVP